MAAGRRLKGRGRLSTIDMLPDECSDLISWANQELAKRDRSQTEIYFEFCTKLEEIRTASGLEIKTPSNSAFNRYSMRQAAMLRRLEDTREIAKTISERFDAETSDDLTLMAAEAIKSLVFELLEDGGQAGRTPKEAMELANALRAATAAQSVSSERRRKVQAEFAAEAEKVVDAVAKIKGLTKDTVAAIKSEILGVQV
ncbi:MAG: DUF3486 family protein [Rhodobacteraceae bacterium]|nr:DUF3486 family protein [Paracoccaceae bacterium]